MVNASVNPLRLRRNARQLEQLIGQERIDIIHAYDAGAAWSARIAASQIAVWLVTTLPDVPSYSGMRGRYASALAQGDRVIAPSNYSAVPIMERYGLRAEQITIVPRVIDTATYDPAAVSPSASDALRERWRVAARRPRRDGARTCRTVERPDSRCPRSRACWSTTAPADLCSSLSAKTPRRREYARERAQARAGDGRRRPGPDGRDIATTCRRHLQPPTSSRFRRSRRRCSAASSRRRRRWDGRS